MTTGIIIQARLNSSRFPRKVMQPINGKKLIDIVVDECKRDLNLRGTLEQIFERIVVNNYSMTVQIIEDNPVPVGQDESKAVYFDRRITPDSEINFEYGARLDTQYLYDKIRMLADPYPNAYVKLNDKIIRFKDAKLVNGVISGRYEIK